MFADDLAKSAKRFDEFLALGRIAGITYCKCDHFLPMRALRKERQWRRFAGDHPDVEVVRHCLCEPRELRNDGFRLVKRENDKPAQHVWPDRVKSKLETGDHAQITAAPAQAPKKVGILRFA